MVHHPVRKTKNDITVNSAKQLTISLNNYLKQKHLSEYKEFTEHSFNHFIKRKETFLMGLYVPFEIEIKHFLTTIIIDKVL